MSNFDAVQSGLHHWLQSLPSSAFRWMCPNRETTCLVSDGDRILDAQLLFRHERGSATAKVPQKRIFEVVDRAPRHQRTRHVRPADRPAIRLTQDFIERDLDAERVELANDFLRPLVSHVPQLGEPPLERVETSQVQGKEMHLVAAVERAQLAPCHDTNARAFTGGARGSDAGDAIVIGKRDRREIAAFCRFDYALRR